MLQILAAPSKAIGSVPFIIGSSNWSILNPFWMLTVDGAGDVGTSKFHDSGSADIVNFFATLWMPHLVPATGWCSIISPVCFWARLGTQAATEALGSSYLRVDDFVWTREVLLLQQQVHCGTIIAKDSVGGWTILCHSFQLTAPWQRTVVASASHDQPRFGVALPVGEGRSC